LLFNPIAPIAIMIKNLLSSFNGVNTDLDMPSDNAIVVMTDAIKKKSTNNGNARFKLNPFV